MMIQKALILVSVCLFFVPSNFICAANIDSELDSILKAAGPQEKIGVIVTFSDQVSVGSIRGIDKRHLRTEIISALKSKADVTQRPVVAYLRTQNVQKVVSLWSINSIAFTGSPSIIRELAAVPAIESIRLDSTMSAPFLTVGSTETPEWNLNVIHAPDLWNMGFRGNSVVVASMDTGVDVNHPDLQSKWRGGTNSWYDPNGQHSTPHDAQGHGTQAMGIIVGGSAGGTAIGVAPDAKWIAVKIFNDSGATTFSKIHQGYQWLLDPDDNAATDDAPDIVNNSWVLNNVNGCSTEFQSDLQALKAMGIAVNFSAGNYGPILSSSVSPANNSLSFAVGATDITNSIANFSSRGPSACDGSIYPEVAAPGVNIRTTDLTFGGTFPNSYINVTGTSFAAPHVTGTMALLLEAFPGLTPVVLENALKASALDLGTAGPDNDSGYGMINALGAYNYINTLVESPPVALDDAYDVARNQTLTISSPGVLGNDSDPDDDPITAILVAGPANGTLSLNQDGSFSYVANIGFNGLDIFTYKATDGSLNSNIATVSISVNAQNGPPVASNDGYSIAEDGTLTVQTPGVLGNDSDPDGDPMTAILMTSPVHGTFTLNGNGSFSYKPNGNFNGLDSFSYVANDGIVNSNVATASINVNSVNDPPIAINDSVSTPKNVVITINVIANDYDIDGNIVPNTTTIVGAPTKGKAVNNGNGTIMYTPKKNYRGIDNFTYTVKDNNSATSNLATVNINIQ